MDGIVFRHWHVFDFDVEIEALLPSVSIFIQACDWIGFGIIAKWTSVVLSLNRIEIHLGKMEMPNLIISLL
jgi:hypothetical protein